MLLVKVILASASLSWWRSSTAFCHYSLPLLLYSRLGTLPSVSYSALIRAESSSLSSVWKLLHSIAQLSGFLHWPWRENPAVLKVPTARYIVLKSGLYHIYPKACGWEIASTKTPKAGRLCLVFQGDWEFCRFRALQLHIGWHNFLCLVDAHAWECSSLKSTTHHVLGRVGCLAWFHLFWWDVQWSYPLADNRSLSHGRPVQTQWNLPVTWENVWRLSWKHTYTWADVGPELISANIFARSSSRLMEATSIWTSWATLPQAKAHWLNWQLLLSNYCGNKIPSNNLKTMNEPDRWKQLAKHTTCIMTHHKHTKKLYTINHLRTTSPFTIP